MTLENGNKDSKVAEEIAYESELIKELRSNSWEILSRVGKRPRSSSKVKFLSRIEDYLTRSELEFDSRSNPQLQRYLREVLSSVITPVVNIHGSNISSSYPTIVIRLLGLDHYKEVYKNVLTIELSNNNDSPLDTRVSLRLMAPIIPYLSLYNLMQLEYRDLISLTREAVIKTNQYLR